MLKLYNLRSPRPASMWPLLKREGLGLQYGALLVIWNRLIGYNPFVVTKQQRSFVQILAFVRVLFFDHGVRIDCLFFGTGCSPDYARTSSVGDDGYTTLALPRSFCCPQRPSLYTRLYTYMAVEYQTRGGSDMGSRWTALRTCIPSQFITRVLVAWR